MNNNTLTKLKVVWTNVSTDLYDLLTKLKVVWTGLYDLYGHLHPNSAHTGHLPTMGTF